MSEFEIRPKHWYQWLNPFWWRKRKLMQAVLDYQWGKMGMKAKVEKAASDAVLYGEGKVMGGWDEETTPPTRGGGDED